MLLVEDDAITRRLLAGPVAEAGYRVLEADRVSAGLHLFRKEKPDLVVLDVNLPDGSGLDFCRAVREHKERGTTPVIMLTGRGEIEDKAAGFSAGADQYLVKPVGARELLLWAEALLRRLRFDAGEDGVLEAGLLKIDPKAHLVHYDGISIGYLTRKEFDLFYFLVRSRPQVISRKQVLSNLWHTILVDHVVDNHIGNLRRRLPQALADRIQTIPGKGFRYLE